MLVLIPADVFVVTPTESWPQYPAVIPDNAEPSPLNEVAVKIPDTSAPVNVVLIRFVLSW